MEGESNMITERKIAEQLLTIKAVSLNPTQPFTWSSGIKSPIYCDNRITMSYPAIRRDIAKGLANKIKQHYPDVEVIAGTATAGIPHAAWVAELLNLPMVYIRSKAKDHGKGNQIEGRIQDHQKMVLIEDLISTGGSVLEAAQAASNEGAQVLGVAAIFTYELPIGIKKFKENQIELTTLTNYTTLIETALDKQFITAKERDSLEKWKKDPTQWSIN